MNLIIQMREVKNLKLEDESQELRIQHLNAALLAKPGVRPHGEGGHDILEDGHGHFERAEVDCVPVYLIL